jgi:hypothetical protein
MEERIGEGKIDVLFRRGGDSRKHQQKDRDRGLQRPATLVVADAMQCPQEEKRQEQMK